MKALIAALMILIASCSTSRYCTEHSRYLKKVNTNKSYRLKGTYCVAALKDTTLPSGNALVRFRVFDRVTGQPIENGVISLLGRETVKAVFGKGSMEIAAKPGKYVIEVIEVGYNESRTKELELKGNQVMMINFYLGTQVDY